MAAIVLNRTTALDSTIREKLGDDLVFTGEQNAHKFVIQCTLNNSHINLTGTVTAQFICPDNATVPINGTIENGKAVVTLPVECYEVPGRFRLSVFNTQGGATVCIYTVVGTVRRTSTGKVVDRGIIPNLNELQQAAQNIAGVENIDITQTKSGNVITVTTTNRNNVKTNQTITEPTATMSKAENGDYTITVTDANGSTSYTIEDTEAAVRKKATIEAVSKVKTALGNPLTITDGMDAPAVKTVVTLEPKQDLHGYNHPWVGGAGKNLCPLLLESSSKGGVSYTVNANGTVTFSGTQNQADTIDVYFHRADGNNNFSSVSELPAGNYRFSLITGGSNSTYRGYAAINESGEIRYVGINSGYGEFTLTAFAKVVIFLRFFRDVTVSNLVAYPMIYAANAGDAFEPFENICPIEGYDTVQVTATGKNLYTDALKDDKHSIGANGVYNYDSGGFVTELIPVGGLSSIKWGVRVYNATRTRRLHAYDIYGNWLRQLDYFSSANDGNALRTVTLDSDVAFVRVSVHVDDYHIYVYGDTSITDFIEDEGSTTSISVAQAAGATVYGGTVTLNEDGSGTLVVDRMVQEYDGTENWVLDSGGVGRFRLASKPSGVENLNNSSNTIYRGNLATPKDRQDIYGCYFGVGSNSIYFNKLNADDTLEAFIARLTANHAQVVWPLATASSYSLTASQLRTLTGENHVWTDGTKLELTYRADKYADMEKFLNAIPTGTKTGDPAVFADGADDLPFEKLTIAVEPHQEGSGDPSPDNIRPITGWDEVKVTRCGKNLLGGFTDYTVYGITIKDTANGISIKGTFASGQTQFSYTLLNKVLPAGAYVVNGVAGAGGSSYQLVITGGGMSATKYGATNNTTFTSDGTTAVMVRLFVYSGNSPYNVVIPWQIEIGSTPTAYEPYTLTTLPISLKYATGSTVYGGTVTINRDGTGSVVVDRAMVNPKTVLSAYRGNTNIIIGRVALDSFPVPNASVGSVLCDILPTVSSNEQYTSNISSVATSSSGQLLITIKDLGDGYSTADMNAWLALHDTHIVYKLATPTTYTLTAPQLTSLLGNNTVWCDAGQVTVKYKRDIGKALDALEALILEN